MERKQAEGALGLDVFAVSEAADGLVRPCKKLLVAAHLTKNAREKAAFLRLAQDVEELRDRIRSAKRRMISRRPEGGRERGRPRGGEGQAGGPAVRVELRVLREGTMNISLEQREAIRCLYAYGCEGVIGTEELIFSSGGRGSATGRPILGTPETWLRLVSLGLATGNGPHLIRLTAIGEHEATRPNPPNGTLCIETTTHADGMTRVRHGRA
jgi:hypothetical protein